MGAISISPQAWYMDCAYKALEQCHLLFRTSLKALGIALHRKMHCAAGMALYLKVTQKLLVHAMPQRFFSDASLLGLTSFYFLRIIGRRGLGLQVCLLLIF